MFRWRKKVRKDEDWDISRIIPRVEILNRSRVGARDDVVQDDEGDIVERFSVDLEDRLKCNMGRAKEDACMLETIINNKL